MTRFAMPRPLVAALAAGAAGLLVAGCSAGQIAETARKNPSVQGVNASAQIFDGDTVVGSVAVRDVAVAYNPEGYEQGGQAPLNALVFNDTQETVTVRVAPAAPEVASEQTVRAEAVHLVGGTPTAVPEPLAPASPDTRKSPGATVSPSNTAFEDDDSDDDVSESPGAEQSPGAGGSPAATASPTPAEPTGEPATFEIPPGGYVALTQQSGTYLALTGLSGPLAPGMSVPVLFDFGGDTQLTVTAPVAPPLTPGPRASPVTGEMQGGH